MSILHTGQQLLLPLTSSVYVNGQLESVDKVLIDVGTGYFVEVRACGHPGSNRAIPTFRSCCLAQKSTDGGIDFCKRKVQYLRTQLETLTEMIRDKQLALQQVSYTLQAKMAQAAGDS